MTPESDFFLPVLLDVCFILTWLFLLLIRGCLQLSGALCFFEHMQRRRLLASTLLQIMKEKVYSKAPGNCYPHLPQLEYAHSQPVARNGTRLINLDLNCANLLRLESYIPGGS